MCSVNVMVLPAVRSPPLLKSPISWPIEEREVQHTAAGRRRRQIFHLLRGKIVGHLRRGGVSKGCAAPDTSIVFDTPFTSSVIGSVTVLFNSTWKPLIVVVAKLAAEAETL